MKRYLATIVAVGVVLGAPATGFGEDKKMEKAQAEVMTTASGLKYRDDKVGTGAEAKPGQSVSVHYTGWLDKDGRQVRSLTVRKTVGSHSSSTSEHDRSFVDGTKGSPE